ncbi:DUF1552 domain-containing protein [Thalassoglobus polymorphus]|uniref:DUF1552 domain-containing protein n=1 Tax=Thalassoglobus polymorphus TaxID=2527994 RepID=A0A517QM32_9PLAN|nr:DUF1552 domain-containing protein [Thalassoglobus polymorphus]QDT32699.1 hypothetical protein Mal48_19460 [Thalassoglobus polymorphus]
MKPISRRTMLQGVGATLALPVLDAMLPNTAWAAPEQLVQNRMGFIFFPNGAIMKDWTPGELGEKFSLPKTLKPLEKHQKDMLVLSGLAQTKARANGDGGGDHARNSAAFLTGAQPRKTSGADIQAGISVDQIAAEKIGSQTKLPSLELGIEPGRQAGRCDSGYSCAYVSNISWKSPQTPMAKEVNPKLVFERMFGTGEDQKAMEERNFYRKSILDFVASDTKQLKNKLGRNDQRKLDEYFASVREIEQRIERSEVEADLARPDVEIPEGVPKDWAEHVRMMYDLMVLAFQTDTTRVCTFMLANSGSNRRFKEIGVNSGHHQISHHRNDEALVANLQKIDEYSVKQFSYFLDRMKSVKEGDGTLLDNSMLLYGSAISDANRHTHHDLPILLAGQGGGTVKTGRHLQYEKETPMNNLFLSMLDRMNAGVKEFGDSTGRLDQLS